MDEELAAFCRREHPRLIRTLVLMVGSFDVAEDLAQETLARVCRDWRRVQRLEAPGAYVHRIALNLATSLFRRRAVERRAADTMGTPPPYESDPAAAVAVRQALQQLRLEQRKVLVARYFLGYSVTETAQLLHLPEGSVKTHTHRGIAALRAVLGPEVTADEVMDHA